MMKLHVIVNDVLNNTWTQKKIMTSGIMMVNLL